MSLEEDVITRLAAVAGGRVYPQIAPPGTTAPYVAYTVTGGDDVYNFSGQSTANRTLLTIECWADTYSEARTVMAAVATAMIPHGLDFVVAGITEEPAAFDEVERLYGISKTFACWTPGIGEVVYIMLTAGDGTTALTAADTTTALTVQQ